LVEHPSQAIENKDQRRKILSGRIAVQFDRQVTYINNCIIIFKPIPCLEYEPHTPHVNSDGVDKTNQRSIYSNHADAFAHRYETNANRHFYNVGGG